jgi:DNA-binding NtrC family response regulator
VDAKANLLVVDDEAVIRDSLGKWFQEEGYKVALAGSAPDALAKITLQHFDLGIVDIKMPGADGVELLGRIREIDPNMIVIMMTGYASVDTAVAALKNGAYDYVSKPFDPDEMAHTVQNALAHRHSERENSRLRETVAAMTQPTEFVGQSPVMMRVFESIQTVGHTEATVLILGESGTGKELCARALHAASPRRLNPLVVIHCGALAETLLESELFGHEKGAFTGAQYRRKGSFEMADGGTVFLDEIGDISLKTQTDLLRVLQEREITRVGSSHPIPVNFRCIAATNKNLETLMQEGKFRSDLFYRLNVFQIELPPLHQRKSDIPLLVDHFVRKYSAAMNKRIRRVSPEAMALLDRYSWPGNIRELENSVERAMVVAQEPEIEERDFSLKLSSPSERTPRTLEDVERAHVLSTIEDCKGNQTLAAEILDIDRVTLHNKLKKYGWRKATADTL